MPSFFSATYGICEGPGADTLFVFLMMHWISSTVVGDVVFEYHSSKISGLGEYSGCHSGGIWGRGYISSSFENGSLLFL